MFTVNGKELDYDIFDADKAEKYETEMAAIVKKMETIAKNNTSGAASIRLQCEDVAECFDHLFGSGTATYIFDGKVNLMLALTSFEELVSGIDAQKSEIEKISKRIAAKYGQNQPQGLSKK